MCRPSQWGLVDTGPESCPLDGAVIAARIYAPERFAMTAGVNVSFDPKWSWISKPRCLDIFR
jgi:hypothetical protein